MNRFIHITIILFATFCALNVDGQANLRYPTYNRGTGLTDRLVTDIIRDDQGFTWIGTEDGLNRFDGREIVQFKRVYDKPNQISGVHIEKLFRLPDHKLLIMYQLNRLPVDIFDTETWEYQSVDLHVNLPVGYEITDISLGGDDEILVLGTSEEKASVYRFTENYQMELSYHLDTIAGIATALYRTALSDWIVFDNGAVIEFDQSGKKRRVFQSPKLEDVTYKSTHFVDFILEFENGDCWITFEAIPGLYEIKPGMKTLPSEPIIHPETYFANYWKDDKGQIIVHSGLSFTPSQKIFLLDQESRQLNDISHWIDHQSLISSIYGQDFSKGLIVGFANGFELIQPYSDRFTKILTQDVAVNNWGTLIRGIVEDRFGNLIVARGINNWFRVTNEEQTDTLNVFENENSFEVNFKCSRNMISYQSQIIGSAHFMDDTYGLLIYDITTGDSRVKKIDHHIQTMKHFGDVILIGCGELEQDGAMYLYDLRSDEIRQLLNQDGSNPFQSDWVLCIEKLQNDEVWIGCKNGLYVVDFDEYGNEITKHDQNSDFPYNFIDSWIYDIFQASDGQVYVGYHSAGFERINFDLKERTQYTLPSGLANDNVAGFVEDSLGMIWIPTYHGLSKFDPLNESFINFYSTDGLPHNEFNRYSAYLGRDDHVYLGTVNGLIKFNPYTLKEESYASRMILSSLSYRNKHDERMSYHGAFDEPIQITIPAHDKSLSLSFNVDNYLQYSNNTFAYRQDNSESEEWNDLGANNELVLNALEPGRYPIFVKGYDKYGNQTINELEIDVHVKQFIYESVMFYILIAALVIGMVFLFLRNRFYNKVKLINLRQNISRDLHDEVGSLLTGMAMKTDLLSMKVDDTLKEDTTKIGLMGREAVRMMRDIVWSIDASKNSVGDLIDRIKEFASEVLPERGIHYTVEHVGCTSDMQLPPEIRKNVYLIVREAINNTMKHSDATILKVRLEKAGDRCTVKVVDNGTNAQENGLSSGLGLKNMRERAQQIKGELDIQREEGFAVGLDFAFHS